MTYLKIDALRPFKPASSKYNHGLDVLTYRAESGTCVAERVDGFLTVLWNTDRTDLIGIKCKGFRYHFNVLKDQMGWKDADFLPLVAVLEAVFSKGLGEDFLEDQRAKYEMAKDCVRNYHLTKAEILEIAA